MWFSQSEGNEILLVSCLFGFLFNFSNFSVFYFKGKRNIMQKFCQGRKTVKYTDLYEVINLSTCYVQLISRYSYSIDLSVD